MFKIIPSGKLSRLHSFDYTDGNGLPRLLCYFFLQCLSGRAFCQLRLEPENDEKYVSFLFVGNKAQDDLAVVAVSLFPAFNGPAPLVRFTHFVPQLLWGNKWVVQFCPQSFCAEYW